MAGPRAYLQLRRLALISRVDCGKQSLLFHGSKAARGPYCRQASYSHQGLSPRRQPTLDVKERDGRKKESSPVVVAISAVRCTSGLPVGQ